MVSYYMCSLKFYRGIPLNFPFVFLAEQLDSHLERSEEELQRLLQFSGRVDDYNETKTREYLATRIKLLLSAYPTSVQVREREGGVIFFTSLG